MENDIMEHVILGASYGGFDGVHIALENDDLKLIDISDDLGLWYDIQSELDFDDLASVTSYLLQGHTLIEALCDLNLIEDRKSTRLNSSHVSISYAVFCLKKNNNIL